MKRTGLVPAAPVPEAVGTVFVRGFLLTALLDTAQAPERDDRRRLRLALQGGAALAAATAAASALARRDPAAAVAAVALGAAGLAVVHRLTEPETSRQENHRGPQAPETEEAAAAAGRR